MSKFNSRTWPYDEPPRGEKPYDALRVSGGAGPGGRTSSPTRELPRRKRSTSADARATCGIPLSFDAEPCHIQVNLEGF